MEKNGVLIDNDVKYFSWSESAKLILKLRKEMMDEAMQEAESTIFDYFEAKRVNDEYEKVIYEEQRRIIKSLNFTRIMNLYMKHSEYMDRRHKYVYEDIYLVYNEKKRGILYFEEGLRWEKLFTRQRRRQKWKKGIIGAKKIKMKKLKGILNLKRSSYRDQFCRDNKFIFSKKVWRYLRKKEIHLYQDGRRILFNNKTWNLINKNEGIVVDWKTFNKIWNNKFIIQSFMGKIDSFRCKEFYTQILEEFKLNRRLNTELINYGRKKKIRE
jgi:hypothetical protein